MERVGEGQLITAIEALGFGVTAGDVASRTGLGILETRQGLLTLAAKGQGHLQVSQSGEMVFQFPRQLRRILWRQDWQGRWSRRLKTLGRWGFYLVRISFGIVLIVSVVMMVVALMAIWMALNKGDSKDNWGVMGGSGSGDGPMFFLPMDFALWFNPDPYAKSAGPKSKLNFLEAIFSFLFGDGDPNRYLEEKRWQTIGQLIRAQGGAIAAEQVAPYLDNITAFNEETEDYILPVLARFNGYPQVSPTGELIYTFPELQVSAQDQAATTLAPYLREKPWTFSQASSGQILGAIALGGVNLGLALILGPLLRVYGAALGGLGWMMVLYGPLLAYALGFFLVPLIRYGWLKRRNQRLNQRNRQRHHRAQQLQPPAPALKAKLAFAQQWQQTEVIAPEDIVYRTDQELIQQVLDQIDHPPSLPPDDRPPQRAK